MRLGSCQSISGSNFLARKPTKHKLPGVTFFVTEMCLNLHGKTESEFCSEAQKCDLRCRSEEAALRRGGKVSEISLRSSDITVLKHKPP